MDSGTRAAADVTKQASSNFASDEAKEVKNSGGSLLGRWTNLLVPAKMPLLLYDGPLPDETMQNFPAGYPSTDPNVNRYVFKLLYFWNKANAGHAAAVVPLWQQSSSDAGPVIVVSTGNGWRALNLVKTHFAIADCHNIQAVSYEFTVRVRVVWSVRSGNATPHEATVTSGVIPWVDIGYTSNKEFVVKSTSFGEAEAKYEGQPLSRVVDYCSELPFGGLSREVRGANRPVPYHVFTFENLQGEIELRPWITVYGRCVDNTFFGQPKPSALVNIADNAYAATASGSSSRKVEGSSGPVRRV